MKSALSAASAFAALLMVAGPAVLAQPNSPTTGSTDIGGPFGSFSRGPIRKLPNGGRPAERTSFPAIKDWSTLSIRLERSGCFGTCPAYAVGVSGDGRVTYQGSRYVAVSGTHEAQIPAEAVRALYEKFVQSDFFWAFDSYKADVTDLPTYALTISFDGRSKTVVDYAGRAVGMPQPIADLEGSIDATAGAAKWVRGGPDAIESLKAEHWDFRASDEEHQSLIVGAAERGDVELVQLLIAEGVNIKTVFGCEAMEAAADHASIEIVGALAAAGAPIHWVRQNNDDVDCDVLTAAARSGQPRIVQLVLSQHPDLGWRGRDDETALMLAAQGRQTIGKPAAGVDYAAVAQLLIAAGADVNARNDSGESAIMRVGDAGVVRVLLAAGAKDINRLGNGGQTALMQTYDPQVAQALLEGGADPWIVDQDGKTALDGIRRSLGRRDPCAAVLQHWMAAHPKPTGYVSRPR